MDGGVDKIVDMFSWNPAIAEKVGNSLAAIKNFKYDNGFAYIVADFNNIAEQHLLVMPTKKNGALYFNLYLKK